MTRLKLKKHARHVAFLFIVFLTIGISTVYSQSFNWDFCDFILDPNHGWVECFDCWYLGSQCGGWGDCSECLGGGSGPME